MIKINLLENDIKLSCKDQGYWHRRLRDVQMYKGSSSPFDYLLWNSKTLVGVECKMINDKAKSKSFPFDRVAAHQVEGLLELQEYDNSRGFIMINVRWLPKKGETYILSVDEFLALRDMNEEDKKIIGLNSKSIPLDYFRENVLQLPRLGRGWGLSKLFEVEQ